MEINLHLEALKDPKPQARIEAVAALSAAGQSAVAPLSGMVVDQSLPAHARACAVKALGAIKGKDALQAILPALGDPDIVVKIPAAMALGKMKAHGAAGALAGLLGDESTLVRKYATEALCSIIDSCASPEKLMSLKGAISVSAPNPKAAAEALAVLGRISSKAESLMAKDCSGLGSLPKTATNGANGQKLQKH